MSFNKKKSHFFKWVGSKRQLIPFFEEHIPNNFNNYYEPFLGSGYMFWAIYNPNSNSNFYLSDINSMLMLTFNMVKTSPNAVKDKLREYKLKHSELFYYEIRNLDRNADFEQLDDITKAARFIYITRAGFNGLYKINSQNQCNSSYCKSSNIKVLFEKEFDEWVSMLNDPKVNIQCCNFQTALNQAQEGDLVYLDPPYLNTFNNSSFNIDDHYLLKNEIDKLTEKRVKIILSHNADEIYLKLYKDFNLSYVNHRRCLSGDIKGRGIVKELIIKNF